MDAGSFEPAARRPGAGAGLRRREGYRAAVQPVGSRREVSGLDLSETMVQAAAGRNRQGAAAGRVHIRQGDVSAAIPWPDESFHKVFSIHSLYFWSDLSRAVSESCRVLAPGGTILLTWSDGKNGRVSPAIRRKIHRVLLPCMRQTGFQEIRLRRGPRSRGYHTLGVTAVKG
ncbi:class I SAM-dependent methyltransferase [Paenibacillus sp. CC-CFT747]|nr:class I SAM-dependent methyltransferase [Paenibacillus sp. CC-CFT747]